MNSFVAVLPYIQIVLAVLLVGGILLQRSDAGLGSAFGGDGSFGATFERRGFEKISFLTTVGIAVIFVLGSILALIFA